jgi:hypothetical protein
MFFENLRTFSPDGSGISDFKKQGFFRRSFLIGNITDSRTIVVLKIVFCSKKTA